MNTSNTSINGIISFEIDNVILDKQSDNYDDTIQTFIEDLNLYINNYIDNISEYNSDTAWNIWECTLPDTIEYDKYIVKRFYSDLIDNYKDIIDIPKDYDLELLFDVFVNTIIDNTEYYFNAYLSNSYYIYEGDFLTLNYGEECISLPDDIIKFISDNNLNDEINRYLDAYYHSNDECIYYPINSARLAIKQERELELLLDAIDCYKDNYIVDNN